MIKSIYKNLLWNLPRKLTHKILYYRINKKWLNYKNPVTLDEKIHTLIATKYDESYAMYADKYLVRDFVKKMGFEELLPHLYGVYNSIEEIKVNELPNKFILKANHGSGNEYYIICKDKSQVDWKLKLQSLNQILNFDFARVSYEYHYSGIQPKIICEELLEDDENERLVDYKVFCFNGEPKYILVCVDRGEDVRLDYYDINWNYIDFSINEKRSIKIIEKPKTLKEMLNVAASLSQNLPLARIDFYEVNGKLYFGEITLTPAGGNLKNLNEFGQLEMGRLLQL